MLKFKKKNIEIEKELKEELEKEEENKKEPKIRISPKEVVDAFNYTLSEGMRKIISATRVQKKNKSKYFTEPFHKCGWCAKNMPDELWSVLREPFKDDSIQVPFESVYCVECVEEWVQVVRRLKQRGGGKLKEEESGRIDKTAQSTDLFR